MFSLETIQDANLFKISQTIMAISGFPHSPSNSNLLAFSYKCDDVQLNRVPF